ncbi:MAG: cobalamin-binding protein [Candidatus Dadabacteria bacterium]|nr:cobalamin-binding protein [Candidatus Dadabacteria bacterium]NIS08555.1 cobalamin-binding protein [Candidatus Dadabacteria bacterium]NIV41383.1 ABC transporter substrate-binding protein [Candidatus Dadabacteria bacterium]NIX14590.1 ABC transporter substrate-binding protein [Candidatus Dadabacteria bacterium]NIY21045.1 ABC transporter substrate-binding protein [Candidatus Dadabacteria bacterium]
MRICSFLPSATEILYELGLGDAVTGVTHECDYPGDVKNKLRVIDSFLNPNELGSKEIDELVAKNKEEGKSTYIIELEKLKEASPDIIITQGLCEVCAVSGNEVIDAAKALGSMPEIISLEPKTVTEVLDSFITVGKATNTESEANELHGKLSSRLETVKQKLEIEDERPKVFALEWFVPPYVGGHWVPEMVELAGGEPILGKKAEPSFKVSWEDVLQCLPRYTIVMPCGYDIDKSLNEMDSLLSVEQWHKLPSTRKGHAYIVDANSYFSRPGPRIVTGIEILAHILHPELFDPDFPADSFINYRNYIYLQDFLG